MKPIGPEQLSVAAALDSHQTNRAHQGIGNSKPVLSSIAPVAKCHGMPTRITAILADGQRVSREVNDIPGFAGKPMQRPDIERKFRGNIGKRWPRQKTDAALQSLWVLENTQDIGALLATLTV